LFGTLAIGDVTGDPQDADDASVLGLGRRRELARNVGARLGAAAQLERRRDPARQDELQERGGGGEIVRMDEGRELLTDPLVADPARDGLEHWVQGLDLPVDREIGRASCRERVWSRVGAGGWTRRRWWCGR